MNDRDETSYWAFIATTMALVLAGGAFGMGWALAKLRGWL